MYNNNNDNINDDNTQVKRLNCFIVDHTIKCLENESPFILPCSKRWIQDLGRYERDCLDTWKKEP